MISTRNNSRGSVALVALCFTTVLGIALASYLAMSNQAMRFSNRAAAKETSSQLAEMGLERSLLALNTNDWSGWTISGTTASRTLTFANTKYGSIGLTGTIKLRIDNYNAGFQSASWDSAANYKINDLMGYNGMWYRCVKAHTNKSPSNLDYWSPAPIPWTWIPSYFYSLSRVVNYNGVWYRCTTAHTSTAFAADLAASYWRVVPKFSIPWDISTTYSNGSFAYSSANSRWYQYINGTPSSGQDVSDTSYWTAVSSTSPPIFWRWASDANYNINDVVYRNSAWYRCIQAHINQGPPNATYWEDALSGSWAWSSATAYDINDVVYSGGSFYRCIQAHTNQGPPNAAYWVNAPLLPVAWDAGRQYNLNDTVSYNGTWYLSIAGSNVGQNPATATTYWTGTSDTASKWNAATAYSANNYASYGGVWYRCILGNTNKAPNDPTYWTAAGAPVVYAAGTASLPASTDITTLLRGVATKAPLFPNAIAATSLVNLSSTGTIDSYDSSVNSINTAGSYSTYTYNQTTAPFSGGSPNLGYSAVIAAGGTSSPSATITSATVKGYVAVNSAATTPYAPLWTYSGSTVLTGSGSTGLDLTRVSRSPYIPTFDIQNVTGGTIINGSPTGTVRLGTPGAPTPSVYRINGDIYQYNPGDLLYINGPVILDVTGMFYLYQGKIIINPPGSLEVHFAGELYIGGNSGGGIQNLTLDPKKCVILGTSTYNSSGYHYFWSNIPFYGVLYMPSAYVHYWNSGYTENIYGAVSASNVYFNHTSNLHFDTSLRSATIPGVDQPFTFTEWRELTDATEQVTLP